MSERGRASIRLSTRFFDVLPLRPAIAASPSDLDSIFDKAITPGLPASNVLVIHDARRYYLPESQKLLPQFCLSHLERQITYIDIHVAYPSLVIELGFARCLSLTPKTRREILYCQKREGSVRLMSIPLGTTTVPLSDIVQPLLLSASGA